MKCNHVHGRKKDSKMKWKKKKNAQKVEITKLQFINLFTPRGFPKTFQLIQALNRINNKIVFNSVD